MNLNELSRKLDELAEHSLTPTYFSSSFEKLLEFLMIVLETKGKPGWHEIVNRQLGSDLTKEDAEKMQPFLSMLSGAMRGGGVDTSTPTDSSKPVYYESLILEMFKKLAAKMQELGPFNYEKTDIKNSDYPVGNPIVNAIQSIPIPPLKLILTGAETAEKTAVTASPVALPFYLTPFKTARSIVLPHRAAATLAQTLLSLLRFASAASPIDVPFWRQILSVTSAIMHMFKGDWQSALLSLIGIYSQSTAYAGIIVNVVMDIFSLMDVRYQENIRDGLLDVPKSLFVGLLLTTFQIFATFDMRKKTSEVLDKILKRELVLTENIKGTGDPLAKNLLEAQQGGLVQLNFNTLNLLQTIMHRKAETCSTSFQAIISPYDVQNNPILRILFLIMNIPVTADEIASVCGKSVSWADGMIQAMQEKEGLAKPSSAAPVASDNPTKNPVAPATPVASDIPTKNSVAPAAAPSNSDPTDIPTKNSVAPAAPVASVASVAPAAPVASDNPTKNPVAPAAAPSTSNPTENSNENPIAAPPGALATITSKTTEPPTRPVAPPQSRQKPTGPPVTNRYTQALRGGLRRKRKLTSSSPQSQSLPIHE